MNEVFIAALSNDSSYIKEYLEKNHDDINKAFEYAQSANVSPKAIVRFGGKQLLTIGAVMVASAPLWPILALGSVYMSYRIARDTISEIKLESYNGWTLLECAIYANASETASILVSNGADITPRAKALLNQKKLKYPQMVDAVTTAEHDRTTKLSLNNHRMEMDQAARAERATRVALEQQLTNIQQQLREAKLSERTLRQTIELQHQNPQPIDVSQLQVDLAIQKTRKKEYKSQVIALVEIMEREGFFKKTQAKSSELPNVSAAPYKY